MTKRAPILETSMTETGGSSVSVIRAWDLFGHWSLVLGQLSGGKPKLFFARPSVVSAARMDGAF
jgi:hypothetical protein